MVQIVWTDLSVFELKDIYYVTIDSKRYAKNQVDKIKAKTLVLKTMPESGRIVPKLENSEIPQLIEGNYRIVYRIKIRDYIEILTVHYISRDFYSREII